MWRLVAFLAVAALGAAGCTGGDSNTEPSTGGGGGQTPVEPAAGSGDTGSAAEPAGEPIQGTAILRGRVMLEGTPKEMPSLLALMQQKEPKCAEVHAEPPKAEQVVVGENGGLANVFVYISKGMKRQPAPSAPVIFNQKGCIYSPHVLGVQVGQKLLVENDDPVVHNVNMQPEKNTPINKGQAAGSPPVEVTFRKPEVPFVVKCDIHPWMNARVGVVEHPFFTVTDPDGTFQMSQKLPPGKYTLTAWHELYKTLEKEFTVTDGQEAAEVDFTFKAD